MPRNQSWPSLHPVLECSIRNLNVFEPRRILSFSEVSFLNGAVGSHLRAGTKPEEGGGEPTERPPWASVPPTSHARVQVRVLSAGGTTPSWEGIQSRFPNRGRDTSPKGSERKPLQLPDTLPGAGGAGPPTSGVDAPPWHARGTDSLPPKAPCE